MGLTLIPEIVIKLQSYNTYLINLIVSHVLLEGTHCDSSSFQLLQLWEVVQLALLLKVLRQYILANDFAGTLSR